MDALLARVDAPFLLAVGGPVPKTKMARQAEIIKSTVAVLPGLMERFEINNLNRICHFVAQIGHESDSFCTVREYADGSAYEGRKDLGNVKPGDGKRFPGRGEIQCTGRRNARNFTSWIRGVYPDAPDFEQHPDEMEEFPWAVWVAIWFWDTRRLNIVADRDDLIMVTRIVNGGKNGLDDRERKLAAAEKYMAVKTAILPIAADVISASQANFPVLYRGVPRQAEAVEKLQRMLAEAGFYHMAIDGDFGAGTEGAVKSFQARRKLVVDGIVGSKTYAQLVDFVGVAL